jgi:hypothetical protein
MTDIYYDNDFAKIKENSDNIGRIIIYVDKISDFLNNYTEANASVLCNIEWLDMWLLCAVVLFGFVLMTVLYQLGKIEEKLQSIESFKHSGYVLVSEEA